jgi:WD40 repeat protein
VLAVADASPGDAQVRVYDLDPKGGPVLRTSFGLPQVASSLAFSPDGRRLAIALIDGGGVLIWKLEDDSQVKLDPR